MYSAENGCFIKTRPSRASPEPTWVNMVANFNLTWKAACLEILNYVSRFKVAERLCLSSMLPSSRSELPVPSLKNAKPRLSGVIGVVIPTTILQTANGLVARPRRPRITFSTGSLFYVYETLQILTNYNIIITVLASGMAFESSPDRAVSSFCLTTSLVRLL